MTKRLSGHSAHIEAILNTVGEGIITADTEQVILLANQEAERIFGYQQDELYGVTLQALMPEKYRARHHTGFSRAVSSQELLTSGKYLELEGLRKDGEVFPLEIRFTSLIVEGERFFTASVRDITARKRAQALRHDAEVAATEAEQANEAKSAFLANMSHELRSPLNAIIGFSQLLQRSDEVGEGQRESVRIIGRSGEHLLALINDVLEMSRIEAGRTVLEESAFDLPGLINSIVDMFRLTAQDKGLQLSCVLGEEVPRYAYADEGKLRQILINLLGNAIKFTQVGGVHVEVHSSAGRLIVEVADSGPGIAPEELETLFDVFVQTQSGRQTHTGTGLGLAISQRFAQLMGGDIEVDSAVDRGSTFRLEQPLAPAQANDLPSSEVDRKVLHLADGQAEWRILAVDDQADTRRLLRQVLEPLGFQVREASDGQEGIQVWREWQPQLIWMDMRMPVMDGYEATRQIRESVEGKGTRIIALTANAFEEDRQKVLDAGCDDFVRKPFREAELFEKMVTYLGVSFVYADDDLSSEETVELDGEALEVMPESWRQAVRQAALTADGEALNDLIEVIPLKEALLSQQLREMVRDFRFRELIRLTTDPPGSS